MDYWIFLYFFLGLPGQTSYILNRIFQPHAYQKRSFRVLDENLPVFYEYYKYFLSKASGFYKHIFIKIIGLFFKYSFKIFLAKSWIFRIWKKKKKSRLVCIFDFFKLLWLQKAELSWTKIIKPFIKRFFRHPSLKS